MNYKNLHFGAPNRRISKERLKEIISMYSSIKELKLGEDIYCQIDGAYYKITKERK